MIETERKIDTRITLPRRGVKIFPPSETSEKVALAKNGVLVEPFSTEEKKRLKLLIESRTLKQRYPTPGQGRSFMENELDLQWGEQLFKMAKELTREIVFQWSTINSNEPIAVIVYGSIARGLVKRPDHPDPSNIDMAVIGNFTDNEREELFDKIRDKRNEVKNRILENCLTKSENSIGGNAGVHIHKIACLEHARYSTCINYIQSAAKALYDPAGLWRDLETEALKSMKYKPKSRYIRSRLTGSF